MRIKQYGHGDWFSGEIYTDQLQSDAALYIRFAEGDGWSSNEVPLQVSRLTDQLFGLEFLFHFAQVWIDGDAESPPDDYSLELDVSGTRFITSLGPLKPTLLSLQQCTEEFFLEKGLDPELVEPARQPAQRQNFEEVSGKLVDTLKLLVGEGDGSGTMKIAVIIDANGTVEACSATGMDLPSDIAVEACNAITNAAKYTPAVGIANQAVSGFDSFSVVYGFESSESD